MHAKKFNKTLLNFTAFDFETANHYPGSACALGIAVVRNGEVVEQRSWLLKPPVAVFNPYFIQLHGITPELVQSAPTLRDAWPEIKPYLSHPRLVAHNVSFDLNVLTSTCQHFGLSTNAFSYLCSLELSRRAWPSLSSHSLNSVAKYLDLSLNHHNAESDALVCAQLTLAACEHLGCVSDNELAFNYHRGITSLSPANRSAQEDHLQQIRKERANSVKVNSLNRETRTGILNGYLVTENSCPCPDFQERQKPCKHIYRLHMELAGKSGA